MRIGVRVGGAVVVIALVVVLIVVVTGGSNSGVPPRVKNPHIAARAHSRLHVLVVGAAAGRDARPRDRPVPSGPKLATLLNAATGQTVDGIQCQAGEQTVVHVHTHLTIFVNGKARVIPYGIGIPGFQAVSTPGRALRRDGELLLLAARARRRRDHPHRVAEHHARPSPSASSSTSGASRSSTHAGRAGHGEGDGVLHLPGQEADALHRRPRRHPARVTTTRSSSTSGRRSWPPSRSPTGAGSKQYGAMRWSATVPRAVLRLPDVPPRRRTRRCGRRRATRRRWPAPDAAGARGGPRRGPR